MVTESLTLRAGRVETLKNFLPFLLGHAEAFVLDDQRRNAATPARADQNK